MTINQHNYSNASLNSLGAPTPVYHGIDDMTTINIPVLPLNITPVSQASHIWTGAFTRIESTISSTGGPATPLQLSGIKII